MNRLLYVAAALLALTATGSACAQANYPTKPIRFIVPFPPGGGTDFLSRLITNKMIEILGWQVVVDNRPGAGGTIGVAAAASALPDGYTMVMGETANLAVNPALYSKLSYEPLKDLTPITLVASIPITIMVGAKAPYATLPDLIAAAKAKPGELIFASPGNGTVAHLSGERLQRAAGVRFVHVPYKGSAPALVDLIGGRANVFLASLESAMPQINAGTIRGLAVTSAKRTSALPDVPTVAESGYPGFESAAWFGILVPAGTPASIVNRLSTDIGRIVQLPEVRERMASGGGTIRTGPAEFAALLKAEHAKWAQIVKESGAKLD